MKIGIFALKEGDWQRDYLKEKLTGFEISFFEEDLTINSLPEEQDFEAVVVFVGSEVDKEVMEKMPNLKFIFTRSTGFDHVDVEAANSRGIKVAYVPTYGENTVAEHAFGLLLTLSHRIYEAYDRLREEGVYSFEGVEGFDLKGKVMGIVGTGNIGKRAIKIAKGFEMEVIAYDPYPREELDKEMEFEYKENLEVLLKEADVVSLHVPYLESTHHLINQNNILKMKPGAILINTARGAIVETSALVNALQSGHLGGAGLDVMEEEGVLKDEMGYLLSGSEKNDLKTVLENHILIDMPNVIVTPHSAFNTREAKMRILDTTIENVKMFADKGEAKDEVEIR